MEKIFINPWLEVKGVVKVNDKWYEGPLKNQRLLVYGSFKKTL